MVIHVGGCASVVGQTIIVPFDVISQHMMIVGMKQSNQPGGYECNTIPLLCTCTCSALTSSLMLALILLQECLQSPGDPV